MSSRSVRFGMTCRGLACALALAAIAPNAWGQLTIRREAAGVTLSQQTGTTTNTFNEAATGAFNSLTGAGNGVNTGTYTAGGNGFGTFVDQFGGSGTIIPTGLGTATRYFSTGGRTSATSPNPTLSSTATLTLSSTAYYMGLYWTAVDAPNQLDFFNGTTLVGSLSASRLLADPGLGAAYNGNNAGGNTGEKYVYINIYSDNVASGFNRIVFSNGTAGSGFESDSHAFAFAAPIASGSQSGTLVPVPEPAGVLAAAGGLLALARRLRRR